MAEPEVVEPEVVEPVLGRRHRVEIHINSIRRSTYFTGFSARVAWVETKLKTRVTWVVVMVILGTADVILNWLNFVDLLDEKQSHGLIIGPPTPALWICLLGFTIVGSVLYIPETFNTFSVFFYQGQTRWPLTYEMLVTVPLEHIPLSAINYFISHCQKDYGSLLQTACGAVSIMFLFIRLVWYAHMEGKSLKANDKAKLNKGFFMLCCALYACGMAFPIMNWRVDPASSIGKKDIQNISIYLLNAPMLEGRGYKNFSIEYITEVEGNPILVRSIYSIYDKKMAGTYAAYKCDNNTKILPRECQTGPPAVHSLCFKFVYASKDNGGAKPYGQIWYNFAGLTLMPGGGYTCKNSARDLRSNWKLWYFTGKPMRPDHPTYLVLYDPWEGTCTNPTPWYKSHEIDVCGDLEKQFPNNNTCLSKLNMNQH